MTLYDIFLRNNGNPIHKNLHYFPIYERYLQKYRGESIVFFEIGSGGGGSSQMWKRYFGPTAQIVTMDIRSECAAFADDQVSVRIGDQSDAQFIASVVDEFGAPDVVLDDGSHQMAHVISTFNSLYEKTARNGLYMVEDMHTAYWTDWGGGLRREGTFIELCKGLIDELNADHISGMLRPETIEVNAPPDFTVTPFTRSTKSISFFESMVVFERGPIKPIMKRSLVTGDQSLPIG